MNVLSKQKTLPTIGIKLNSSVDRVDISRKIPLLPLPTVERNPLKGFISQSLIGREGLMAAIRFGEAGTSGLNIVRTNSGEICLKGMYTGPDDESIMLASGQVHNIGSATEDGRALGIGEDASRWQVSVTLANNGAVIIDNQITDRLTTVVTAGKGLGDVGIFGTGVGMYRGEIEVYRQHGQWFSPEAALAQAVRGRRTEPSSVPLPSR